MNGDSQVSEVMVYNQSLTSVFSQSIQSYLALKYGITLSGGTLNYLDSSGSVVWSPTTNAGYTTRIYGIGRDDGTSLNQKQS